jgi:hypothetical protein
VKLDDPVLKALDEEMDDIVSETTPLKSENPVKVRKDLGHPFQKPV